MPCSFRGQILFFRAPVTLTEWLKQLKQRWLSSLTVAVVGVVTVMVLVAVGNGFGSNHSATLAEGEEDEEQAESEDVILVNEET